MSTEREARYAEAINRTAVTDSGELLRDLIDSVIAVANAEQADLRAKWAGDVANVQAVANAQRKDAIAYREERDHLAAWKEQVGRVAIRDLYEAIDERREAIDERQALEGSIRALHEMQVEMGVHPWCEADGKPWPCPTIALLTPSTTAAAVEAECAGVRVTGPMSAMICDDDGWVRSGTFHWGTDYKCTGSVHPPLDSPIWPGHEIRCANPIHVVKVQDRAFTFPATLAVWPGSTDNTSCPNCGGDRLRPNFTGDNGLCHVGGTPFGSSEGA